MGLGFQVTSHFLSSSVCTTPLLLGLLHRVEKGQSAGRMYLESGNNLGNAEISGCSMFLKHIFQSFKISIK